MRDLSLLKILLLPSRIQNLTSTLRAASPRFRSQRRYSLLNPIDHHPFDYFHLHFPYYYLFSYFLTYPV